MASTRRTKGTTSKRLAKRKAGKIKKNECKTSWKHIGRKQSIGETSSTVGWDGRLSMNFLLDCDRIFYLQESIVQVPRIRMVSIYIRDRQKMFGQKMLGSRLKSTGPEDGATLWGQRSHCPHRGTRGSPPARELSVLADNAGAGRPASACLAG